MWSGVCLPLEQQHPPLTQTHDCYLFLPQVEYGDLEKPTLPGPGGTPPTKAQHLLQQVLDRFYPRRYRNGAPPEQLR